MKYFKILTNVARFKHCKTGNAITYTNIKKTPAHKYNCSIIQTNCPNKYLAVAGLRLYRADEVDVSDLS